MNTHTYFIGYDAREDEAAKVAAYSIMRRANSRARVYILEHMTLRSLELFSREWNVSKSGQFYDLGDERPFSTGFSHSRFLVFYLAHALKCTGPCMFVDCDWLFLDDPSKVMSQQEEHPHQIGVVSRDRDIKDGSTKMDGMVQQTYKRKLWSALFTFMPQPNLAAAFSPHVVNTYSGRELHNFLGFSNDQFWQIDPAWHYIPSLDPKPEVARGVHFSEFSPWLNPDHWGEAPEAFDAWQKEYEEWLNHAAAHGGKAPWRDLKQDILAAMA